LLEAEAILSKRAAAAVAKRITKVRRSGRQLRGEPWQGGGSRMMTAGTLTQTAAAVAAVEPIHPEGMGLTKLTMATTIGFGAHQEGIGRTKTRAGQAVTLLLLRRRSLS
jgi:hypothetical protein